MDKLMASKLVSAVNCVEFVVIMVMVLLIMFVLAKRKGTRKKSFKGDLVDATIVGKDYASGTNRLPASSHPASLKWPGLPCARPPSPNDERLTTQPSLLQKTSFPAPRLRIPTLHTILHVDDVSAQKELKKKHRAVRAGFQPPVSKMTEQDYFLSDLLGVSLTKIASPGRQNVSTDSPPPLKLPRWLRDPRLPRPPVQPPKPIILGPGVRIKTPAVPINDSLHETFGSSLAKAGPDLLLQNSHKALQVEDIFAHTAIDHEFLTSSASVQTSVSEVMVSASLSSELLEVSSTAKVPPSRTEDNTWPTSSDPTSLKVPRWLRDPRLRRPPMQPSLPQQKAN